MKSARYWTLPGVLLILVLGAGLWWLIRVATAPLPTLTLPNGGPTVQVTAITTGTNHTHGPWLARFGAVPGLSSLVRFFGIPTASATRITEFPSVVIWLEPVGGAVGPTPGAAGRSWRVALADESGFVSGQQEHLSFWAQGSLAFAAVPRRSRELDLRFFEGNPKGDWLAVTNLRVANPWFGKFPQWQADRLPVTRTNGPLVATLEEFTIGHDHHSFSRTLADGQQSVGWGLATNRLEWGSAVRGRFTTPGAPEVSWVIAASEFSDATGNRLRGGSQSWTAANEVRSYRVDPSLWPGEAAWRIQLTLKRDRGIPTNELFALKGVALPAVDATNDLSLLTTNWAGVKVTFRHLIRRVHPDSNSWSSGDLSEIALKHAPLPPGVFFDLVHVRVEGEEQDLQVPSWSSSSSGDRTYSIREIPEEARMLELHFAVQRGRTVEFLVKPELGKAVPAD